MAGKVIKASHKMVMRTLADCSNVIVIVEVDSLFPLFPRTSRRQSKQRIYLDEIV